MARKSFGGFVPGFAITLFALGTVLALGTPTFAKEEAATESAPAGVHAKLIDQHAGSVVAIKFVMNARVTPTRGGSPREIELNRAVIGTVVHADGLVMVPITAVVLSSNNPQFKVSGEPSKIRVIFPGDDKEHPAILGAQDSRLAVAFILLKSTENTKMSPVSFEADQKTPIGSKLYGVGRLDEGFDYAPYADVARVVGKVKTPREMMLLRGAAGTFAGSPLFAEDGAAVGVAVRQKGAGDSTTTQNCLLPLGVIRATITRSLRESKRALEEAIEADAEAEEAAKEAEEAVKAANEGNTKKEDGDKKKEADGKADADGNAPEKATEKPAPEKPTEPAPEKPAPEKPAEAPSK